MIFKYKSFKDNIRYIQGKDIVAAIIPGVEALGESIQEIQNAYDKLSERIEDYTGISNIDHFIGNVLGKPLVAVVNIDGETYVVCENAYIMSDNGVMVDHLGVPKERYF